MSHSGGDRVAIGTYMYLPSLFLHRRPSLISPMVSVDVKHQGRRKPKTNCLSAAELKLDQKCTKADDCYGQNAECKNGTTKKCTCKTGYFADGQHCGKAFYIIFKFVYLTLFCYGRRGLCDQVRWCLDELGSQPLEETTKARARTEREREKERESETDRQTGRQTDRQSDREGASL